MPHDSSAKAFSSKLERKEVGQAAQLEAFVHILGDRCYMETVVWVKPILRKVKVLRLFLDLN